MRRKRHSAEEKVPKLRQVDVLTAQGHAVVGAIRTIGAKETNCAMGRSSTRSARPGSQSKPGDGTTTLCGLTHRSDTGRQHLRLSSGQQQNR
jgi:hypothetical protein